MSTPFGYLQRVNAATKKVEGTSALPSLSILVADDEPDTVATLAALLTDEQHIVHTVTHGGLVMEAVRRFRPQVCILDIEMPGQNGFGLARDIGALYGKDRPTLIAISGKWVGQTDKLLAQSVGFDAFLSKPTRVEDLLSTIESAWLKKKP
jgi:two-component system response regulator DesR